MPRALVRIYPTRVCRYVYALVWMAGSQKRQAGDYLVDALLSMRRTTKKKAKRKGAIVPPNWRSVCHISQEQSIGYAILLSVEMSAKE